jgi:hypothetical protein
LISRQTDQQKRGEESKRATKRVIDIAKAISEKKTIKIQQKSPLYIALSYLIPGTDRSSVSETKIKECKNHTCSTPGTGTVPDT